MSDLQLSLLMIGAVVVGAVFLYNWIQERRLRQRLQQSFGEAHADVLLKAGPDPATGGSRLEKSAGLRASMKSSTTLRRSPRRR